MLLAQVIGWSCEFMRYIGSLEDSCTMVGRKELCCLASSWNSVSRFGLGVTSHLVLFRVRSRFPCPNFLGGIILSKRLSALLKCSRGHCSVYFWSAQGFRYVHLVSAYDKAISTLPAAQRTRNIHDLFASQSKYLAVPNAACKGSGSTSTDSH
jgi:hypothetical protein